MNAAPEPFVVNSTAGNSAPFGGRRRHHKLKLVTKKVARKHLKKMGMKIRGGAASDPVAVPEEMAPAGAPDAKPAAGGRRHRGTKKHTKRHRRSLFGLKY